MKKFILTGLILLTILSSVSCKEKELKKYEASFLILFNTVTRVVGYAESNDEFMEFANYIHDQLEVYHQLYDKYNSYEGINNIKTINDNAGVAAVKVDQKVIDMLLFAEEAYDLTSGKMNVALGSVLEIWHEYRTAGIDDPMSAMVPPMDELKEANQHTAKSNLLIDEMNSTVFLTDKDMRLDVGAVAKGYATEMVTLLAKEKGYNNFLLSVGGNTRSVGGKGKSKEPWSVGIQNPDKDATQSSLFTMSLSDLSLVSSGDYERYYTVEGKRYHHIIDPDTLMPADYFTAVSIICEDSGMADTLSTAIFNLPYEKGNALIESLGNAEALWIFKDGTIKYTDGFENLIKPY